MGFPGGSDGKESSCNARDLVEDTAAVPMVPPQVLVGLSRACLQEECPGMGCSAPCALLCTGMPPARRETWVQSLGWEDPLEKEMATHSSTLAWKIPWTEEPDRLQSVESKSRTGHGTTDWFQIGKGVHQGCILSPCLFNLYAEYIMSNAGLEEAQAGIKIAGRNITIPSSMVAS